MKEFYVTYLLTACKHITPIFSGKSLLPAASVAITSILSPPSTFISLHLVNISSYSRVPWASGLHCPSPSPVPFETILECFPTSLFHPALGSLTRLFPHLYFPFQGRADDNCFLTIVSFNYWKQNFIFISISELPIN